MIVISYFHSNQDFIIAKEQRCQEDLVLLTLTGDQLDQLDSLYNGLVIEVREKNIPSKHKIVPRQTIRRNVEINRKISGKTVKRTENVVLDVCVLCQLEFVRLPHMNRPGEWKSDYNRHVRNMHSISVLRIACPLCFLTTINDCKGERHKIKSTKTQTVSDRIKGIDSLLPKEHLNDLFTSLKDKGATKMIKIAENYYTEKDYDELMKKRKLEEDRKPLKMMNLKWTDEALAKKPKLK